MNRISKEIFRKTSLSSVILPYYSNPLFARKMMLKLCKGSRSTWLENNSQWSNLLTNFRTKIRISCSKTANNHVKYLAKITPFVELHFSINFKTSEDLSFTKNLVSLIENMSLNKFKVLIRYPIIKIKKWESGDAIKSVLHIVNLISGFCRQYEIDIFGKKIQVTELPDWITLKSGAIFGENQWIVSDETTRFARLLGEYTHIWKELGVGDLDSSIIHKIKSQLNIYNTISTLRENNDSYKCILSSYSDYFMQRHDCLKVLELAYLDRLYIQKSFLNKESVKKIFLQIKPILKKMRSLKSISFKFYEEIQEAFTQLDLQELHQNGVKINFFSSNHPLDKYKFIITTDDCIVFRAQKEINALNIKAKGDIVIRVCSLDFTYIINNEYLLCNCFIFEKFEIDCELIESKQTFCFPKFANKLEGADKSNLVLIPLNRIKQVSYMVYFGCTDKKLDGAKYLTNEFDNNVCKPLAQPSSLFCLLNKETKINIILPKKIDWSDFNFQIRFRYCNSDLRNEFEEELKSFIPISQSIRGIRIDLIEITNENLSLFLQLLQQCIRLNVLIFKVRESDKRISQDIIDTIAKHNECLSQIAVSINTEGAEFHHFSQISCDRNIIVRALVDE